MHFKKYKKVKLLKYVYMNLYLTALNKIDTKHFEI